MAGSDALDSSGDGGPATKAGLEQPCYIAIDGSGNLFIGRNAKHYPIRRVDAQTGIITSLDLSKLTGHKLKYVRVINDPKGNLYAVEPFRIFRLDLAPKTLSLIAGSKEGFGGDGGPATKARFRSINDLAFDSQGNLFIADSLNNRVRRIDKRTGIVTTVAGNGLPLHRGGFDKMPIQLLPRPVGSSGIRFER